MFQVDLPPKTLVHQTISPVESATFWATMDALAEETFWLHPAMLILVITMKPWKWIYLVLVAATHSSFQTLSGLRRSQTTAVEEHY